MADDAKVQQFVAFTGGSVAEAHALLDAANGNVEAAVGLYFDTGGAAVPMTGQANAPPAAAAAPAAAAPAAAPFGGGAAGAWPGSSGGASSQARSSASSGRSSNKSSSRGRGGFRTLADMRANSDDEDEAEDGSRPGQEYYAGGASSGIAVQDPRRQPGPNNKKKAARDTAERLMERARAMQAEQPDAPAPPAPRSHWDALGGGQALGDSVGGGGAVGGGAGAAGTGGGSMAGGAPPPAVECTLVFYRNGFVVDDGPLRAMDDPANHAFLEALNRGFVPRELEQRNGAGVDLKLVDKRGEDYVPPKYVAFSGGGLSLAAGSGSGDDASAAAAAAAAAAATRFELDEAAPTTRVQVRLYDGTRLTARLNLAHTIAQVRAFVEMSRPDMKGASYRFLAGHPPKPLDDPTATVESAGLAGSVIVQKRV